MPRTDSTSRRAARGNGSQLRLQSRPGAHLFNREQVAGIQRARILAAMFDVASERGASNVSVAHVVERSGVSRRTFYDVFTDRDDCFLAAFEEALAFAGKRVLPAYASEMKWRERVRAGLLALLSFLDEEPAVGRLLIVESLLGGPQVLKRRARMLAQLVAVIDEGRSQAAGAGSPMALTAEGLVGGALAVIQARITDSQREPLVGLTNELMGMIVLPYQGAAAARRELERPVEWHASDWHDAGLLSDPFKEAGMRLTYRTVRVMLAVAERSGASNRQVGDVAGITDQGQISKLLGRIQRLGLIENTGMGPDQGTPNAWTLTEKGEQLIRSICAHTDTPDQGESR